MSTKERLPWPPEHRVAETSPHRAGSSRRNHVPFADNLASTTASRSRARPGITPTQAPQQKTPNARVSFAPIATSSAENSVCFSRPHRVSKRNITLIPTRVCFPVLSSRSFSLRPQAQYGNDRSGVGNSFSKVDWSFSRPMTLWRSSNVCTQHDFDCQNIASTPADAERVAIIHFPTPRSRKYSIGPGHRSSMAMKHALETVRSEWRFFPGCSSVFFGMNLIRASTLVIRQRPFALSRVEEPDRPNAQRRCRLEILQPVIDKNGIGRPQLVRVQQVAIYPYFRLDRLDSRRNHDTIEQRPDVVFLFKMRNRCEVHVRKHE